MLKVVQYLFNVLLLSLSVSLAVLWPKLYDTGFCSDEEEERQLEIGTVQNSTKRYAQREASQLQLHSQLGLEEVADREGGRTRMSSEDQKYMSENFCNNIVCHWQQAADGCDLFCSVNYPKFATLLLSRMYYSSIFWCDVRLNLILKCFSASDAVLFCSLMKKTVLFLLLTMNSCRHVKSIVFVQPRGKYGRNVWFISLMIWFD